jgi:hypothetical protein
VNSELSQAASALAVVNRPPQNRRYHLNNTLIYIYIQGGNNAARYVEGTVSGVGITSFSCSISRQSVISSTTQAHYCFDGSGNGYLLVLSANTNYVPTYNSGGSFSLSTFGTNNNNLLSNLNSYAVATTPTQAPTNRPTVVSALPRRYASCLS